MPGLLLRFPEWTLSVFPMFSLEQPSLLRRANVQCLNHPSLMLYSATVVVFVLLVARMSCGCVGFVG